MINIEKTINNLEADWLRTTSREQHIVYVDVETVSCVLELLKRHKPVPPRKLMGTSVCECGHCKSLIVDDMNYCPVCGQAVKRE